MGKIGPINSNIFSFSKMGKALLIVLVFVSFVRGDKRFIKSPRNGLMASPLLNGGHYEIPGKSPNFLVKHKNPVGHLSSSIPGGGIPGEDYPILSSVPLTDFSCNEQGLPGYYADTGTEAKCQVFHICQMFGRMDSFLCPNGTVFNQKFLVCDWWYNVDCETSSMFVNLNSEIGETFQNSISSGSMKHSDRYGSDFQSKQNELSVMQYSPSQFYEKPSRNHRMSDISAPTFSKGYEAPSASQNDGDSSPGSDDIFDPRYYTGPIPSEKYEAPAVSTIYKPTSPPVQNSGSPDDSPHEYTSQAYRPPSISADSQAYVPPSQKREPTSSHMHRSSTSTPMQVHGVTTNLVMSSKLSQLYKPPSAPSQTYTPPDFAQKYEQPSQKYKPPSKPTIKSKRPSQKYRTPSHKLSMQMHGPSNTPAIKSKRPSQKYVLPSSPSSNHPRQNGAYASPLGQSPANTQPTPPNQTYSLPAVPSQIYGTPITNTQKLGIPNQNSPTPAPSQTFEKFRKSEKLTQNYDLPSALADTYGLPSTPISSPGKQNGAYRSPYRPSQAKRQPDTVATKSTTPSQIYDTPSIFSHAYEPPTYPPQKSRKPSQKNDQSSPLQKYRSPTPHNQKHSSSMSYQNYQMSSYPAQSSIQDATMVSSSPSQNYGSPSNGIPLSSYEGLS